MRAPTLVRLATSSVQVIRRGKVTHYDRSYVVLRFGDAERRLAVSAKIAKWIRASDAPGRGDA